MSSGGWSPLPERRCCCRCCGDHVRCPERTSRCHAGLQVVSAPCKDGYAAVLAARGAGGDRAVPLARPAAAIAYPRAVVNAENPNRLALQSKVDVTFWAPLGELKLHSLKLDEGPLPLTAFWAASDRAEQPGLLTVAAASLPAGGTGAAGDAAAAGVPPRSYAAQGELYVLNTVERLPKFDRKAAVQRVRLAVEQWLADVLHCAVLAAGACSSAAGSFCSTAHAGTPPCCRFATACGLPFSRGRLRRCPPCCSHWCCWPTAI